jgi:hypothetical protein
MRGRRNKNVEAKNHGQAWDLESALEKAALAEKAYNSLMNDKAGGDPKVVDNLIEDALQMLLNVGGSAK